MKLYYADPPYLRQGKRLYGAHHAQAADWDDPATHERLVEQMQDEADGWVLHSAASPDSMALYARLVEKTGARWCSWVKQFAAFKRNVPVAYAWEPVIIKAGRRPVVSKREIMRDWIMCPKRAKEERLMVFKLTCLKCQKVVHMTPRYPEPEGKTVWLSRCLDFGCRYPLAAAEPAPDFRIEFVDG